MLRSGFNVLLHCFNLDFFFSWLLCVTLSFPGKACFSHMFLQIWEMRGFAVHIGWRNVREDKGPDCMVGLAEWEKKSAQLQRSCWAGEGQCRLASGFQGGDFGISSFLLMNLLFFFFISNDTKPHKRGPLETTVGPRPPLPVVTSVGCELWMLIHASALQVGQMGDATHQNEMHIQNTQSLISWTPGCNSSFSTQTE